MKVAPAMKKGNKAKGKRYSDKEKAQVLSFVEEHNAENGRGGISAASRKFGVTALTISNWLVQAENTGPNSPRNFAAVIRRLAKLNEQIIKTEGQLAELQKEYDQLKSEL